VKSASLKKGMKHEKRKHHGLCRRLEKIFNTKTENGMIKCKEFRDVNGIKHEWIPAIKLLT